MSGPPAPPPGFVLDTRSSGGGLPPPPPGFTLDQPGYLAGAESIGPTPWYDQGLGALVGMRGRGPTVRDVLDTLPTVGGAVGGVVGGAGGTAFGMGVSGAPGAIGGATLGGGAGEAARQQIGDLIGIPKPQTAMERTKAIGTEAAIQGAAEAGGRVLATGAKALGRGMVENAVRPSITIRREFPNVIDTIVKERLPVGAMGGAKGSERAALRLAEESKAVKDLLAKSTAGGKTFETSKLAEPVLDLLDEVAQQPLSKADMTRLETMLDEFTAKKGPLSPTDVQKLKQRAQAIAKPIYKAAARGEPVSADQAISGRFNAAIATGAKDAMETIPGVAEGEAKKRELIGAKKALSAAEMRSLPLWAEAGAAAMGGAAGNVLIPTDNALKKSAVGWLVARMALSPRSVSRVGLTLTRDEAGALLKQFPRLGAYLLSGATREERRSEESGSR